LQQNLIQDSNQRKYGCVNQVKFPRKQCSQTKIRQRILVGKVKVKRLK